MTQVEFESLPPHVQQFIRSVEEADLIRMNSTYLVRVELNDVQELTRTQMAELISCPYFEKVEAGIDSMILTFRRF
jgi:hypothetical protein